MPRPQKCRLVCAMPSVNRFSPDRVQNEEPVLLRLDEYETIRLIDYASLTQAECAAQMEIARTTVTAIYDSARKKLAQSIVEGRPLTIAGGNVQMCKRRALGHCTHCRCHRVSPKGKDSIS